MYYFKIFQNIIVLLLLLLLLMMMMMMMMIKKIQSTNLKLTSFSLVCF